MKSGENPKRGDGRTGAGDLMRGQEQEGAEGQKRGAPGGPTGRRFCEFQLLSYVPDPVRNEAVHIGVIRREQASAAPAQVRFTRDWRRVRCLDPDADTALLEGMESELRRR